jgi:hypothetical protein
LKNEQEFNKDLEALGDEMRTLLSCLPNAIHAATIIPVRDSIVEIMKAVLDAARFMNGHLEQNRLRELDFDHTAIHTSG